MIHTVTVVFAGQSHPCLCPSWRVRPGAVAWLRPGKRSLGVLLDRSEEGATKLRVKRIERASELICDGSWGTIYAVRIVPKREKNP